MQQSVKPGYLPKNLREEIIIGSDALEYVCDENVHSIYGFAIQRGIVPSDIYDLAQGSGSFSAALYSAIKMTELRQEPFIEHLWPLEDGNYLQELFMSNEETGEFVLKQSKILPVIQLC